MGITALYPQGTDSIKLRYTITSNDPTDSTEIARQIATVVKNCMNGAHFEFNPNKYGRGNYYNWYLNFKEEGHDSSVTISQDLRNRHGPIQFFINLPQNYDELDRNIVLEHMKRRLRL